jgi:hypothetical protein
MAWVVILVVLVLGALVAVRLRRRSRSDALRRRFGPEYERLVARGGDPRDVESHLRELVTRRAELGIHALPADVRSRFGERWRAIQLRFVDDPAACLADADALVREVVVARGYPAVDVSQRLALLSVDHPRLVETYRSAVRLHRRSDRSARPDLDDMRTAFRKYRTVFDELAGVSPRASHGRGHEGQSEARGGRAPAPA